MAKKNKKTDKINKNSSSNNSLSNSLSNDTSSNMKEEERWINPNDINGSVISDYENLATPLLREQGKKSKKKNNPETYNPSN